MGCLESQDCWDKRVLRHADMVITLCSIMHASLFILLYVEFPRFFCYSNVYWLFTLVILFLIFCIRWATKTKSPLFCGQIKCIISSLIAFINTQKHKLNAYVDLQLYTHVYVWVPFIGTHLIWAIKGKYIHQQPCVCVTSNNVLFPDEC